MSANINFLSSGRQANELREQISVLKSNNSKTKLPIGIKTPLEFGSMSQDSLFKMNTDVLTQVSNNYKTFLLTKKGEVLCKPDFGLSLHDLFNRTNLELNEIEEIVMSEIGESTKKYFPLIKLKSFESNLIKNNNKLIPEYIKVNIIYSIEGFDFIENSIGLVIRRSI